MGRSWGGERMSDSSHHRPRTDQGKHSSLRCVIGLNWIRWRQEEASLMNNDLLVVRYFPLWERAKALW